MNQLSSYFILAPFSPTTNFHFLKCTLKLTLKVSLFIPSLDKRICKIDAFPFSLRTTASDLEVCYWNIFCDNLYFWAFWVFRLAQEHYMTFHQKIFFANPIHFRYFSCKSPLEEQIKYLILSLIHIEIKPNAFTNFFFVALSTSITTIQ